MKDENVVENISRVRPSVIVSLDNEHLSQVMAEQFNCKLF